MNTTHDAHDDAALDSSVWPNADSPCYDCGSTHPGRHTADCDFALPGDACDLPAREGTQHWTGELPTTNEGNTMNTTNTTTKAYARQIDADGIDGNAQQTLNAGDVRKGTLVQLKHGGPYYVAAGYDRTERAYCFDKHDDTSKCRYLKKTAQVWAD